MRAFFWIHQTRRITYERTVGPAEVAYIRESLRRWKGALRAACIRTHSRLAAKTLSQETTTPPSQLSLSRRVPRARNMTDGRDRDFSIHVHDLAKSIPAIIFLFFYSPYSQGLAAAAAILFSDLRSWRPLAGRTDGKRRERNSRPDYCSSQTFPAAAIVVGSGASERMRPPDGRTDTN